MEVGPGEEVLAENRRRHDRVSVGPQRRIRRRTWRWVCAKMAAVKDGLRRARSCAGGNRESVKSPRRGVGAPPRDLTRREQALPWAHHERPHPAVPVKTLLAGAGACPHAGACSRGASAGSTPPTTWRATAAPGAARRRRGGGSGGQDAGTGGARRGGQGARSSARGEENGGEPRRRRRPRAGVDPVGARGRARARAIAKRG